MTVPPGVSARRVNEQIKPIEQMKTELDVLTDAYYSRYPEKKSGLAVGCALPRPSLPSALRIFIRPTGIMAG